MAKLHIDVETVLKNSKEDIENIKKEGGFKGDSGAKSLNKIQALLSTIEKTDVSKLDVKGLRNFLDTLEQLNDYIKAAGRNLTNYSKEYLAQEQKVKDAQDDVTKAQEEEAKALEKQAAAIAKIKNSDATFYRKSDGHKLTRAGTIASTYSSGDLEIRDHSGQTPLTGAPLASVQGNLDNLVKANEEVEVAKQNVSVAEATVKAEQLTLENTPKGNDINPVTETTEQHANENYQAIKDERDSLNNAKTVENQVAGQQNMAVSTSAIDKQTTSLGRAFKAFTIYGLVVRNVRKALREAVKTVKELDRALTEQAMVTGLTRKQTYGLLKDYQQMAARLGTTTKEVSSTMTQFLRQGRSINESLKLTEAAVSAAKVAGISAADSINYLTTAINGFRLSAEDAMKVSDKFAAVAASAATSYEEIAIALSKVAAQANLAGMSIDYTTALLTKGIETTREAPETIGTALKTVIARMRELGDYGETLEGDMDLNNVESQLAYIGIALRDDNGELRSTEDVLNDLGEQWDSLNANQQAAIAKALAGTRQQSRLIAMMSDYERVIELQQIAERSQGATMAQMATYMEGMDAALNKVSNAWEQIVSTAVDSDFIIGLVDSFANLLNFINGILENGFAIFAIWTAMSLIALNIVNKKIQEYQISQAQNKIEVERQRRELQSKKIAAENYLALQKETLEKKKQLLLEKQQSMEDARQVLLNKDATDEEKEQAEATLNTLAKEAEELEVDIAKHEAAQMTVDTYDQQNALLEAQNSSLLSLSGALSGIVGILGTIFGLYKLIATGIAFAIKLTNKQERAAMKEALAEKIKAAWGMAGSASAIPYVGWAIGIAILAAIGIAAIAIGVAAANQDKYNKSAEKAAKDINALSKEIYDLNKKSESLKTVVSKFEDIDNKVLKTNKDLQEMSELLDSAADSLSDEEKAQYEGLTTAQARKEFLKKIQDDTEKELANKRQEQKNIILGLRNRGGDEWDKWLTSNDAEIIQSRDAMYALNNAYLYKQIDGLKNVSKEEAKAIESITQNMLANVSASKAAAILADQSQIDKYVKALSGKKDAVSILESDDYSVTERVNAFRELHDTVKSLGDKDITAAFETINKEWQTFANMSDDALTYIDHIGASIDGINELASAIQKIGYNSKESADLLEVLFEKLEQGYDLGDTIKDMFGTEDYNAILNAYDKAFGTTILNMGQNIDKFKNTIDAFYDKAKNWSTMSETDKTSFISEHADLFKGESGGKLLEAFESGNYSRIEEALRNNDALTKQREQLIKDIDKQLEIEYARQELDHAYIRELEQNKKELEDLNKIYLASLQMRYDQQQAQLNMYKDLLQKETDALTEALEKRKEAYQKYFDTINRDEEELEYEEKARTLITNISKLGSSTNADAMAKSADLAKQLEDLEKDRLKELRQQAQEAVIKGIEDEVSKISDNLEKLLNNEQALLNAMTNDANNPTELIASLVSAQFANGNNTELGMQSYLQEMQSTFAAIMPGIDWSNVDVERRGDSLILNIMGKEIQLTDGEQQTIYDAIQQALRQLGYN